MGFDDRECFRFTFARIGESVDGSRISAAIERKNEHYLRAIRSDMRLVPGAAEFVAAAADEGHRLAIVSGALRREIELVLDLADLRRHFSRIVSAEDVSACKPDPQGFNRAREALAIPAARCVVVEDSLPGLAAARAAGLRCVMLTTSHAEDALADGDVVWRDFIGRAPRDLPWADA